MSNENSFKWFALTNRLRYLGFRESISRQSKSIGGNVIVSIESTRAKHFKTYSLSNRF